MTYRQYFSHYLKPGFVLLMLATAAAVIALSLFLIYQSARRRSGRYTQETRGLFIRDALWNVSEQFYELIFSNTSILMFVSIYFIFDYFGAADRYSAVWNRYSGIILLGFIVLSIAFTSFMDNLIIPLSHVHPGERAAMRLIGMLYMLVIFAYIKFIYEDDNYDTIIIYFLTLVIGRFVYFDASLESFRHAMKETFQSIPILLLSLMCTAVMALVGFRSGYLLRLNGVVMNLFIAHLYLLLVIFIVHRSRILQRVGKRTAGRKN